MPKTTLNKVPPVSLAFWTIKIMSTTVGETGADYLAVNVGLGTVATDAIMAAFLLIALFIQIRSDRYIPWIYWLSVVLLSIVGTQITDALTDNLGVSLYASSGVFAAALAALFGFWFWREGTLSITDITTRKRELYYWAAILVTFALGTATGDLTTEEMGLGFRIGILAFGGLLGLIAMLNRFGVNSVLTFWLAYILTRPLGASLGDFLSQAKQYGGMGLGNVNTSIGFLGTIVVLVFIVTQTTKRAVVAESIITPIGKD